MRIRTRDSTVVVKKIRWMVLIKQKYYPMAAFWRYNYPSLLLTRLRWPYPIRCIGSSKAVVELGFQQCQWYISNVLFIAQDFSVYSALRYTQSVLTNPGLVISVGNAFKFLHVDALSSMQYKCNCKRSDTMITPNMVENYNGNIRT